MHDADEYYANLWPNMRRDDDNIWDWLDDDGMIGGLVSEPLAQCQHGMPQIYCLKCAQHEQWLRGKTQDELDRREARRRADAIESGSAFRPAVHRTLSDAISDPLPQEVFAVEGLLPFGGNVVFSARWKKGKSVVMGQLARAYADEKPFLDSFQVHPPEGKSIAIFNYEMSQSQFETWLTKMQINNTDRIHGFHLRGRPHPLHVPDVRDAIVDYLTQCNAGLWIIDPANRAMVGRSVNDDKEVSPFLGWVEEIKERSGVREVIIAHHMGHESGKDGGEQRAMGATAWSAWPDALWMLTADKEDNRYFSAIGRDVEVEEQLIEYDPETMTNRYGGGTRKDIKEKGDQNEQRSVRQEIIDLLADKGELKKGDIEKLIAARPTSTREAITTLVEDGTIDLRVGARNSHYYRLSNQHQHLPSS